MKIKKVDDKPLVIHTKSAMKFHTHQNKEVAIKGQNVYTVNRSPKIKSAHVTDSTEKKSGKAQYRKSTIHQGRKKNNGVVDNYRRNLKESKKSIKVRNSSIKLAGAVGARAATKQMEGGEEIQQASMIAYGISRPITGTASKGAELFRQRNLAEKKRKIKKVEVGRKLSKRQMKKTTTSVVGKTAKESRKAFTKKAAKGSVKKTAKVTAGVAAGTATTGMAGPLAGIVAGKAVGWKMDKNDLKRANRNRKINFFLDKMKSQEDQTDSIGKMVKDLILQRAGLVVKKIVAVVLPAILTLFLLMAIVCLPVILVVAVIYNSPFAIFLPPLSDGDTVMTVTSQYVAEFNQETSTLANNHTGYDEGKIVYVDYEGSYAVPTNYYDVMCVYMVKYGVGDTATVMNDLS
ncbi:MAG: hydrolase, partial [Lachnospiraceae bacterium]